MALNLSNLFKSASELILELDKIEEISIKKTSTKSGKVIENSLILKVKKDIKFIMNFQKIFEKKYMLLSLALLYESIRMYIKSSIKTT